MQAVPTPANAMIAALAQENLGLIINPSPVAKRWSNIQSRTFAVKTVRWRERARQADIP
jgi:hypothetical protein